jgi:serine/threonine protein kinase
MGSRGAPAGRPEPDEVQGYVDLRPLARDDVATRFRALRGAGDSVSVTVFSTDFATATARRGFLEGHAAAGVAGLLDVQETGRTRSGRPYVVTRLCARGSMADLVGTVGPLPVDQVVRCLVPVGETLQALHELGLRHDDIRPDTIFLEAGRPMIGDILSARLSADRRRADNAAPPYTAPEVLHGDAPTPCSDVYSLAASAFFALTGRPPYPDLGGVSSLVLTMRSGVAPTVARADTPPRLRRLLFWALHPDPRTRCPDARTFHGELLQTLVELESVGSTKGQDVRTAAVVDDQGSRASAHGTRHRNSSASTAPAELRDGQPDSAMLAVFKSRSGRVVSATSPNSVAPVANYDGDGNGLVRPRDRDQSPRRIEGRLGERLAIAGAIVFLMVATVANAVWHYPTSRSAKASAAPAATPVADPTAASPGGTTAPAATPQRDTSALPGDVAGRAAFSPPNTPIQTTTGPQPSTAIQSASQFTDYSAVNPTGVDLPQPVGAAHLLVLTVAVTGGNPYVVDTVTDDLGNTWQKAVSAINADQSDMEIWYTVSTKTGADGAYAHLERGTGGSSQFAQSFATLSEYNTAAKLHATGNNASSGTAHSSGTLDAIAGDVIVGADTDAGYNAYLSVADGRSLLGVVRDHTVQIEGIQSYGVATTTGDTAVAFASSSDAYSEVAAASFTPV